VRSALEGVSSVEAAAALDDLQMPAIDRIVASCPVGGDGISLSIRTYDEPTRELARRIRDPLLVRAAKVLTVPSAENVSTTALVQGTRRPVPWPQATLLVQRDDIRYRRECVGALQAYLTLTLTALRGGPTEVWLRELPDEPGRRSRVIELWLPPAASWSVAAGG